MSEVSRGHGKLVTRLLVVAVAMFAFGVFAMPPLYQTFCEITGIGQAGVKIASGPQQMEASDRTVKIRFVATTNSELDWDFKPVQKSLEVPLGQASEAAYFAGNRTDESITGMAVFNVSPPSAARYFVKTECFCFTEQVLAGNEQREMPVYFFVQPDLPEKIEELTLSYTFFKNAEPSVAQAAP